MRSIIVFLVFISLFSGYAQEKKQSREAKELKSIDSSKKNEFTFRADFSNGIMSSLYKRIVLKGNPEVISSDFKLRADEIEIYGEESSYIEARGNVYYEDYKNKMNVKAQFLFFNRRLDNFYLEKGVELEDLENELVVKAERIEGGHKTNIYIMQYSVKIYKGDTFARAENGIYNKDEKEIVLEGVPMIYQDDNYYSASRIIFNTETNKYNLEGSVEGKFTQMEEDVSGEEK
ncbi:LptA/OstA family protein [Candidatus Borreliella tachyglossi]|uniref:LptA/OstA family protein n=1 Tax=Candidatus Borreliella tachyglossi TaxID=1964448 RepID=UPI004041D932